MGSNINFLLFFARSFACRVFIYFREKKLRFCTQASAHTDKHTGSDHKNSKNVFLLRISLTSLPQYLCTQPSRLEARNRKLGRSAGWRVIGTCMASTKTILENHLTNYEAIIGRDFISNPFSIRAEHRQSFFLSFFDKLNTERGLS